MNTNTELTCTELVFNAHLYNGRLTVTNPETDSHTIYEVATEKWDKRGGKKGEKVKVRVLRKKTKTTWGHRMISFGKLNDDGSVTLFKKTSDRVHEVHSSIIMDPLYWSEERGLEYQYETTCRMCGRALTDHDSIKRGIGPVCLGYLGLTDEAKLLKKQDDKERFGELRVALERDEYQLALVCLGYMDSPDYRAAGHARLQTWLTKNSKKRRSHRAA